MEITKIKGKDILKHFSYTVNYFIYSKDTAKRVDEILGNHESDEDATDFLNKNEEMLNSEIQKIASNISKEREDVQQIVINLSDDMISALFIRISDMFAFFEDNKEHWFTISISEEQFLIDCLINRWRELQHNGLSSPFLYL